AGALVSTFASYVLEKKLARQPERFGRGAIEGLSGPEASNNAAAQSAFVPLLSLGIPPNAVMGVVLGALMIQGIAPGPRLATDHPEIFWGVIASMLFGNIMLVILNVPMVRLFVSLLRVPTRILAPCILLFCAVGAYSINNNMVDVAVAMICGVLGYVLRRTGFDPVPLLIAFVLGGILEKSVRQALLIGYGSPYVFVERPIALSLLVVAALLLLLPLARQIIAVVQPRSQST
ncbi:MAG: tripartite tricarboxylate transporter permease, partial [Alphaproteobacteria bacterium]|nr:tripartite tricarboxylate transporter permease [Alphaproteobacteria bacterium]